MSILPAKRYTKRLLAKQLKVSAYFITMSTVALLTLGCQSVYSPNEQGYGHSKNHMNHPNSYPGHHHDHQHHGDHMNGHHSNHHLVSSAGIPASIQILGSYVSTPATTNSGLSAPNKDNKGIVIEITSKKLRRPADEIIIKASSADGSSNSCRYSATAKFMGQDALHGVIYTASLNGTTSQAPTGKPKQGEPLMFFRFIDNQLIIDSNKADALNQYCAANSTLKGEYKLSVSA